MSSSFDYCIVKLKEDLKIHKKYFKNYIFNFFVQKLKKLKSLSLFPRKNLSKIIRKNINNLQIL